MNGVWDLVDDSGNVLGGSVQVGTSFSATLVYDDATPDSNPSPTSGNYLVAPAQFSFTLSTATFVFTHVFAGFNEIDVQDLPGNDSIAVYAETFSSGGALPAFGLAYANPVLNDYTGTVLSSDALVGLPWTYPGWDAAMSFFADIADGNPNTYFDLEGTVTSITQVPEPGTFVLVSIGLLALGHGRRRRD
jgi:hypothetical protein